MAPSNRSFILALVVAALLALSACGSDTEPTSASADSAESTDDNTADDDHGDEHPADDDHADDDHADDDHADDDDESSSGLGAHEHGAADLSVAWTEGDMVIDLISPTHNIFGFEYEPTTDEDLALADERTKTLTEPGVIAINAEAGCELAGEVVTELEFEGSHAELTASWLFTCENPDEINQLDAAVLFEEFPNLEDVDAQWVSPSGQSAAELSPSSTTLALG